MINPKIRGDLLTVRTVADHPFQYICGLSASLGWYELLVQKMNTHLAGAMFSAFIITGAVAAIPVFCI